MRILYYCDEYPPCLQGGVGTFTKDLAEGLVKEGHQVTVVGIYYDKVLKLESVKEDEINGVTVIRIPQYRLTGMARIDTLFSRFFLYNYLRKLLRNRCFDLIESPLSAGWFPFGVAGTPPFITRLHGGQGFKEKTLGHHPPRMLKLFERMQINHSDYVAAVSGYIADVIAEIYGFKKKIWVIHNGVKIPKVELKNEIHVDEGVRRILFYGSVNYNKGVKELLQAILILVRRGYNVRLVIAGKMLDQKYNEELYSIIRSSDAHYVEFKGVLDRENELFPLIAESDICCFPSKVEAFGLAPVEAMAFQKPVVFTKLAAGPEVIRDGVDGLLCDPFNPDDIADKIAMFLDDAQLSEKCALSAYDRVRTEFTMEKMVRRNIEFYYSCINQSQRNGG